MVMYMLLLEVHSTTLASSVTYCCSILQDTNRETIIEVKQNMNKNSNPSSQVGHPQGFLQLQCGVLVKTTNKLIQFLPE